MIGRGFRGTIATTHVAGDGDDGGQFHRAFDLRMTGQDLFDQGRARARHADHEDRIARIATGAGTRGEELTTAGADRVQIARMRELRIVGHLLAAQRVAAGVVPERFLRHARVFQRLAQRELEMQARVVIQVIALQLGAHRHDVGRVEAHGLEIGQAPPRTAEARLQFDRTPVRGDRIRGPACGLQRMAVADPDRGLVRYPLEHVLVGGDGIVEIAELAQHHRLHVLQDLVAGLFLQQCLQFFQRFGVAVVAVEHHGIVLARGIETRCAFQRALQQQRRLVIATEPDGQLGEHAHCRHIAGLPFQTPPQHGLRIRQTVLCQCRRRRHQFRVVPAVMQMLQIGVIGTILVPCGETQLGQGQPGTRQPWLQTDRAIDRTDGDFALAHADAGDTELQPRPRRLGLGTGQGIQHRGGMCEIALGIGCHSEQQHRARVRRHRREDFACLFGGERRICLQQAQRMGQRGIHADGRNLCIHRAIMRCGFSRLPRRPGCTARAGISPAWPSASCQHVPHRTRLQIPCPSLLEPAHAPASCCRRLAGHSVVVCRIDPGRGRASCHAAGCASLRRDPAGRG